MAAALIVPAAARAQGLGIEIACVTPPVGVAAVAPTLPFATLTIDGSRVDLSRCIVPSGKMFTLNANFFSAVATGNVHAVMNPDPFITFGATTTTLVPGPTTFAFLFGTPIVPAMYNTATSTGGVSFTNGASGTSTVAPGAVYPTYISGYGTLGLAATNLGVDLASPSLPCVSGPAPPFTHTETCAQGTTVSTFAPTLYDNLEALLTYSQSDVSSVGSWSGAVTIGISTVPEPATAGLVLAGVLGLGLGGLARRRVV